MILTTASLSLSATWIVWSWAYAAHRRPVPAPWTRVEAVSIAAVLVWLILLAIGAGALIAAAIAPIDALRDQSLFSGVVTLGAPVLAAMAVPRLRQPLRGTRIDAAKSGVARS